MGLDMYMYERYIDTNTEKEHTQEFAYWRKHHDLHGFFEKEWQNAKNSDTKKAKQATVFNGVKFPLTKDILLRCIEAIKNNKLPPTTGFFFGDGDYYDPEFWGGKTKAEEQKQDDISICEKAIQRLEGGIPIYYDSWW